MSRIETNPETTTMTDIEKIGDKIDAHDAHDAVEEDPIEEIDEAMNKRLERKLDMFIIPVFGALFLLAYLDRGNLGNANIASPSISQSTGMTPKQYGAAVSVFFATYVFSEPIWAVALKKMTARVLLGGSTVVFGAITLGTAFATQWGHVMACRVLLGWFEGGMFPAMTVYLFMNYRREQVGRRISYIYLCLALSGAFGGLIASGLIRIESGPIVGWQYLYIIEGALTMIAGPIAYFWIPKELPRAWFYKPEEKEASAKRARILIKENQHTDEFSLREVFKGLTAWQAVSSGCTQFSTNLSLNAMTTFMPAIISGMGYSNTNTQLLTVPVYFFAAMVFLTTARLSERWHVRGYFVIGNLVTMMIGNIILATTSGTGPRYFAVFLIASGIYSGPGLNISWVAGNVANHYKRSAAFGLNQLMGNSAGAAVGSIFIGTWGPLYRTSAWICVGVQVVGISAACMNVFLYKRINKQREIACANGALDQPELGDKNPHFRYFM